MSLPLSELDTTLSKVLYHSIFLLEKKKDDFTVKGQLKGINYGSTGSMEGQLFSLPSKVTSCKCSHLGKKHNLIGGKR